MLFASYGFIGFVIVLLVLYYVVPKRFRTGLLLASSVLYYAMADVRYLIFIAATVVSVWYLALKIEDNNRAIKAYVKLHKEDMTREEKKAYRQHEGKRSLYMFIGGLTLNLLILVAVKYTGFILSGIGSLRGTGEIGTLKGVEFIVPLGISFYTFQSLGYLIDVYRESIDAERSLPRYALFITFFPQLIQGPISRYDDLSKTLYTDANCDIDVICRGIERILWGYFKKLVIADRLLMGVSTLISDTAVYRGGYVLCTMLLYTLELYADFTGGIDITIGIAEAMGITIKENFVRPYLSVSLAEYWRRWHISMCSWFRDYVFYPMSTSTLSMKLSKWARKHISDSAGGRLPVYLSSFVVWFCTGIWHGASLNFIVWGLLNFLVLTVSEELTPLYGRFHKNFKFSNGAVYKVFMMLRTFVLICVLNLFDCFVKVSDTAGLILSIFKRGSISTMEKGALLNIGLTGSDYMVAGISLLVVLAVSIYEETHDTSVRDAIRKKPYVVRFAVWMGLFTATVIFGVYGIGYDASQFIYNRF